MSDIFETIQDTMIMAGRELESSAKELTAKAKLQYEIKQAEGYLDELYKELGKEYYQSRKSEETENETFAEIAKLTKEVNEKRNRYMEIKGRMVCPNCGSHIEKDSAYCAKCGKPLFE